MFEFKFIRHAEGTHMMNSGTHVVGLQVDAQLTDKGKVQAHEKGVSLQKLGYNPDFVHSSGALRCTQTTRFIIDSLGVDVDKVNVSRQLYEMDQGSATGMTRTEVYSDAAIKKITRFGKDYKHEEGESMNEVGLRGYSYLQEQIDQKRNGLHLIIAHGGLMSCVVSHIFNLSQHETVELWQSIPVTGEVNLSFSREGWKSFA